MRKIWGWVAFGMLGQFLMPVVAQAAAPTKPQPMYIGGKWVQSRAKQTRAIQNPATLQVLGHTTDGSKADVDHAVGAARGAFPGWRAKLPAERAAYLLEVEQRLLANRIELARTITKETGKPYPEAYDEVGGTAAAFGYYANLVKGQAGEVAAPMAANQINYATRSPYGVVAAIIPFNFPLLLNSWKVAPALAAGNTVVIKPPHQNPLSSLLMAKVFKGLPPGVVNVVTGAGETGKLLASHPEVDVVAFTGSSKVGAMIKADVAKDHKVVHVEGGGIDPSIVFADANIKQAAKELTFARAMNAGQVCTKPQRIIVDEKVIDAFTKELLAGVKALRVGDPMDPGTDVGPLVSREAVDRIEQQVNATIKEGGVLLQGGHRIAPVRNGKALPGHFFQPTVLLVKDGMLPSHEEFFGPVYTIMVAKNADHAIQLANSTKYALGASAFATDHVSIHRARTELVGGTVWINRLQDNPMSLSFGGPYHSGGATELGPKGLEAFMWNKTVVEATAQGEVDVPRTDGMKYENRKTPGQRRGTASYDE